MVFGRLDHNSLKKKGGLELRYSKIRDITVSIEINKQARKPVEAWALATKALRWDFWSKSYRNDTEVRNRFCVPNRKAAWRLKAGGGGSMDNRWPGHRPFKKNQ